jgi:peptide-N4-(N-acetyl-beta-glucosaminyl)asparagine amidase
VPTKERIVFREFPFQFSTTFEFRISDPRGIRDTDGSGADGFAFVIQNDSPTALGSNGGGLGYGGIPNSLAIEFDTWQNSELGDPNNNHISVHTQGALPNTADESASLGFTTNIPNLSDGTKHLVSILYHAPLGGFSGWLAISVDNAPVLSLDLDLSQILRLDNGRAFVGFTAATGGTAENHDILRWELF